MFYYNSKLFSVPTFFRETTFLILKIKCMFKVKSISYVKLHVHRHGIPSRRLIFKIQYYVYCYSKFAVLNVFINNGSVSSSAIAVMVDMYGLSSLWQKFAINGNTLKLPALWQKAEIFKSLLINQVSLFQCLNNKISTY